MRIRKHLAAVAAAVVPLVVVVAPAHADTGSGSVTFEGPVVIPVFPCHWSMNCTLRFVAAAAAGTIASTSGVAIITGLSADVSYAESCPAGFGFMGNAVGVATLTGINVVGSLLPLSVPFAWSRVGTQAVITPNGNPMASGSAEFVPYGGVPTCTTIQSFSATVVGEATITMT